MSIPDIPVSSTSINFSVQSFTAQAAAGFFAHVTASKAVGANDIDSPFSAPLVQA
jgi:hypothetical protein